MADETRCISEINITEIDFDHPEWSWGYGYDCTEGFIIRTFEDPKDNSGYSSIRYPLPKSLCHIVNQVRSGALDNLRRQIRNLDSKREALLK